MSELLAFAVRDAAVGAFNAPMYFRSRAEAVRSFSDACRDSNAGFSSHAKDYDFWYVGGFAQSTGEFISLAGGPERVCGAMDYVVPPTVAS